ncbi:response regulator [Flavobacterium cellulosilyticum]|uniref:Response regulator n=1 Tax=Flavobacterium cellulosilyticum TaxID=2541731 RepID=A0A4R5CEV0_9FLAO|nr:response regulator [Flavobacterium cellulosilyticum]TDD98591.1 response regulator [Flavobacterium cellulosilyticum]
MTKNIIWVIDDDLIYQTIIKKLILKTGVFSAYSSFSNGKEAINILKNTLEENASYLPDVILLDINMPIMDGWEFMEEIKKIRSRIENRIKIYIVSSSIAVEDKNKSKSYSDIIGYIPKPISVNDLLAIVSIN